MDKISEVSWQIVHVVPTSPFYRVKAFWKCRHPYVKKWAGFQTKASLTGSLCVGQRYQDNGTTITDFFTGLEWEKKTNDSTVHDYHNFYTWSSGGSKGDGGAFATFLTGAGTGLNVAGFAGGNDWRVPTLSELQTIMLDYACTGTGGNSRCVCTGSCFDSAFATFDMNTFPVYYWSATLEVQHPDRTWGVFFNDGSILSIDNVNGHYVRAVRGGL